MDIKHSGGHIDSIASCTFNIVHKGGLFEAYCEQIIRAHSANGYGYTIQEAIEDAHNHLLLSIEEQHELNAVAEIDAIWDGLLSRPESAGCLNEMASQLKANEEAGEFSESLETAIKKLIGLAREGMTEREQSDIAQRIQRWIIEVTTT